MSDEFDADAQSTSEGWQEISREDAMERIERALTRDLVSFEVDTDEDPTVVGVVVSHTWFIVTEEQEQREFLLALRDPANADAPLRWFTPSAPFLADW